MLEEGTAREGVADRSIERLVGRLADRSIEGGRSKVSVSSCQTAAPFATTPGRTDGDGRRASFKPCLSIHIVHAYIHVHACTCPTCHVHVHVHVHGGADRDCSQVIRYLIYLRLR